MVVLFRNILVLIIMWKLTSSSTPTGIIITFLLFSLKSSRHQPSCSWPVSPGTPHPGHLYLQSPGCVVVSCFLCVASADTHEIPHYLHQHWTLGKEWERGRGSGRKEREKRQGGEYYLERGLATSSYTPIFIKGLAIYNTTKLKQWDQP